MSKLSEAILEEQLVAQIIQHSKTNIIKNENKNNYLFTNHFTDF